MTNSEYQDSKIIQVNNQDYLYKSNPAKIDENGLMTSSSLFKKKALNKSIFSIVLEKTKSTSRLMIKKKMLFMHLAFAWSGISFL